MNRRAFIAGLIGLAVGPALPKKKPDIFRVMKNLRTERVRIVGPALYGYDNPCPVFPTSHLPNASPEQIAKVFGDAAADFIMRFDETAFEGVA